MTVATGLIKLNVGSGNVRGREGYTTLDADPRMEPDIVATVPPIPLDDESCETIYASHFIEHLDRDAANAFIAECYRVLGPRGDLEILTPYALCESAWQDPTHKSFYVPDSFLYYTPHFDYLGYDHLERRLQLIDCQVEGQTFVLRDGREFTHRTVHVRLRKPEGADNA